MYPASGRGRNKPGFVQTPPGMPGLSRSCPASGTVRNAGELPPSPARLRRRIDCTGGRAKDAARGRIAMQYVDGFVLPMPSGNVERYRDVARRMGEIWREHGALAYVECVADDVAVAELTSFPRAVLREDGETVVFAWIVYESREHRDAVNRKVLDDARVRAMDEPDLFDSKRMIYGGFSKIVDL
jgi:uncharacterized protein YbaA (DUF1428 family)